MREKEQSESDFRVHSTRPMLLLIDQPGELYDWSRLQCEVEVVIEGIALSGLKGSLTLCDKNTDPAFENKRIIYLFPETAQEQPLQVADDARNGAVPPVAQEERQALGSMPDGSSAGQDRPGPGLLPSPTFETRLVTEAEMIIEDAFQGRKRAPFQQLHFDEVIPDQMRIVDIKTALHDRGFEVTDFPVSAVDGQMRHLIVAERPEGADEMHLWIVVDGRRYTTQRRTEVPGGQVYTSTFESGDIAVYIRGEMSGDTRVIVQEMNLINQSLRDRFERLRTRR